MKEFNKAKPSLTKAVRDCNHANVMNFPNQTRLKSAFALFRIAIQKVIDCVIEMIKELYRLEFLKNTRKKILYVSSITYLTTKNICLDYLDKASPKA